MKNLALVILQLVAIQMMGISQETVFNEQSKYVAEGYDVVAYFSDSAVKGDKEFETEYQGAKFRFSTAENLKSFKENPERYVPQYGGYCAYAIADKGKKVSINPKTFEIRDGKLYLFYNSWGVNTLKSWKKEDPILLIIEADKNWGKELEK